MARRRYLLAYDIRDERRLRAVANCVEGYGHRMQYSVFICDLSPAELVFLRTDIDQLICHSEDSIMLIDLGSSDNPSGIVFLGRHQRLPDRGATII
ncbi:MAG: CRISPR-associated endonuclease Cas2 [Dactylosporangium sp.]|nr:CRISPR-associated endonuclease Cas2 [Dactylosporangium sp.]NNJ63627.1 CRISPR-associated endonuclease Cas2 [Dactylosporangium sp.]